jgi:hypothetical protein
MSVRNFPAAIIRDQIPIPSEKIREAPFALDRPNHQLQIIEIHLPDDSEFAGEQFSLVNDWFRYDFSVTQNQRVLQIKHDFEILSDVVPVDKIGKYQAEVDKVEEYLDYYIEVDLSESRKNSAPGFLQSLAMAFSEPLSDSDEEGSIGPKETPTSLVEVGESGSGISGMAAVGLSVASFIAGIVFSAFLGRRKPKG